MQEQKTGKRLIVVGDIHGQLDPFVKILQHANLINNHWDWCGGQDRLIQMGDVYDRGPKSRQTDLLLDKIQRQAANSTGEVVRLVGNHELEIMLGNFSISGLEGLEAKTIQAKLNRQVLNGELRGAYAYKGLLFTHAGVTQKLFRIFEQQLEDASAHNMAVLINLIFKESIRHQFFKHPIFNISIHRSGMDRFGGIFWEDITDLIKSFPQSPLWQVVGHTQVQQIVIDRHSQIIPVDVGMHRRLEYLVIESGGTVPKIVQVDN